MYFIGAKLFRADLNIGELDKIELEDFEDRIADLEIQSTDSDKFKRDLIDIKKYLIRNKYNLEKDSKTEEDVSQKEINKQKLDEYNKKVKYLNEFIYRDDKPAAEGYVSQLAEKIDAYKTFAESRNLTPELVKQGLDRPDMWSTPSLDAVSQNVAFMNIYKMFLPLILNKIGKSVSGIDVNKRDWRTRKDVVDFAKSTLAGILNDISLIQENGQPYSKEQLVKNISSAIGWRINSGAAALELGLTNPVRQYAVWRNLYGSAVKKFKAEYGRYPILERTITEIESEGEDSDAHKMLAFMNADIVKEEHKIKINELPMILSVIGDSVRSLDSKVREDGDDERSLGSTISDESEIWNGKGPKAINPEHEEKKFKQILAEIKEILVQDQRNVFRLWYNIGPWEHPRLNLPFPEKKFNRYEHVPKDHQVQYGKEFKEQDVHGMFSEPPHKLKEQRKIDIAKKMGWLTDGGDVDQAVRKVNYQLKLAIAAITKNKKIIQLMKDLYGYNKHSYFVNVILKISSEQNIELKYASTESLIKDVISSFV